MIWVNITVPIRSCYSVNTFFLRWFQRGRLKLDRLEIFRKDSEQVYLSNGIVRKKLVVPFSHLNRKFREKCIGSSESSENGGQTIELQSRPIFNR